ncbi:MAG TPA: DUF481 domain-containing protein [Vicinamibacteria bacterium]|nr:DUF481 domain-containing protein [Vicinamibacteria bacterium]
MGLGLALPVLTATSAPAAPKTDVVVLRNGDRLTGEVDQLERGKLVFKTDDMGTLQIEWDKLQSVTAAALFDVETLAGRAYVGSLSATAVAGELRIVSLGGVETVLSLLEVATVYRIGASFWQRLEGSFDAGASYTKASDLFSLDVSAAIAMRKPGFEVSVTGNTTLTSQPGVEETSRSVLALGYQRRFEGLWVALVQGQLEQNKALGFDLRSSATAGGGRYLVQNRNDRLLAGLGVRLNREKPVEGDSTNNVEATAALTYDRFAYDFPKVDIAILAAGFLSLSESGRYRFELSGQLKRELVRDFYATLRGYDSYDSRPPTEGAVKNDYGVTFAIGWSF